MIGHKPHTLENITSFAPDGKAILHYTCNSPSMEILLKNGINVIGDSYGCADKREVLYIPLRLFKKYGRPIDPSKDQAIISITSEYLLRDLEGAG